MEFRAQPLPAHVVFDESALLSRVEAADLDAFEQVMRRYNQRLYRLALAVIGDASEAEDVLQESYVRAYQRLSSFSGRAGLGVWLACIVRNTAIDQLRSRRARQAAITLECDLPGVDGTASSFLDDAECDASRCNPDLIAAEDETRAVLERAIATLPEQFRSVFMLREVEGLSLRETAEYLDIPVATVKTRDHRARMMLREKLGGEIEDATRRAFPFLGSRCDLIVARVLNRLRAA
jgi:RNA polymerase sigma-70 factor, ECF subfamily